ncbi:hypothetical protein GCM10020220_070980 [Nonomuraea rubra]
MHPTICRWPAIGAENRPASEIDRRTTRVGGEDQFDNGGESLQKQPCHGFRKIARHSLPTKTLRAAPGSRNNTGWSSSVKLTADP